MALGKNVNRIFSKDIFYGGRDNRVAMSSIE